MSTRCARQSSASIVRFKHVLLGNVCIVAICLALAAASSPADAKTKHGPARADAEHASKLPFGDIPKGPLQIFVSINQQKLHFYSDGTHVADELVATGVPGHLTPMGVFSVIERDRYHHSNIYDNAPMPFMERITWSGVALHEGVGLGHQASHGCIRMPHDFAARLWQLQTMGMRVVIARPELKPTDFADPHLFVRKQKPGPSASLPQTVKTALTIDPGTKTDASDPPPAGKRDDLVTGTVNAPDSPAGVQPAQSTRPLNEILKVAVDAAAPKEGDPAATDAAGQAAQPADMTAPIATDDIPLPLPKPSQISGGGSGPIAIFVSRKEGKIFVRQDFTPLFEAPVQIDRPKEPLGTHVFTALDYMPDHSTFRWNVVTLPPEAVRGEQHYKYVQDAWGRRKRELVEEPAKEPTQSQPAETPQEVLARIQIPQDVIDQISQLMVPGSSLVVSDHGLGDETDIGGGTDFIVITR